MKNAKIPQRVYPIGGYAPGNYACKCITCKISFIGYERAYQCEPCAIKDFDKINNLKSGDIFYSVDSTRPLPLTIIKYEYLCAFPSIINDNYHILINRNNNEPVKFSIDALISLVNRGYKTHEEARLALIKELESVIDSFKSL